MIHPRRVLRLGRGFAMGAGMIALPGGRGDAGGGAETGSSLRSVDWFIGLFLA